MGTRIRAILSHELPNATDTAATLGLLEQTVPEALAVRQYWRVADLSGEPPGETEAWECEAMFPRDLDRRHFSGPGGLFVTTTPVAAYIGTGGRWRGFLTIEPLRRVHLAAFRAIAKAFDSDELVICSDGRDDVFDLLLANGTRDECSRQLRSTLGPPQPSVDDISTEVVAAAEHAAPTVWYVDRFRAIR